MLLHVDNSHVKTLPPEARPDAMPWRTLKKMMTDKYCPRGKIKKLEFEMWNLKVKGNDVVAYSQRFQELALMCDRMFPEEIDQVEKYVGACRTIMAVCEMTTKDKSDGHMPGRNTPESQPNKRQTLDRAYARKEKEMVIGNCDDVKILVRRQKWPTQKKP
ncbi:putative reverse transcriptase domain-containing protein [Tanacetum coccineum]